MPTAPTPRQRLIILIALFAFLALGMFSFITGYALIVQANERKLWPKVTGTVVRSEVIGQRAYRPNIVYIYSFKDSTYTDSTNLDPASFGGRNARRQKATVESAQFHPGDSVIVFIHPKHPEHSTLHPGVTWDAYARTGTGVIFILASLFAVGWLLQHPLPANRRG